MRAIATRLRLSEKLVEETLAGLERIGLAAKTPRGWEASTRLIHVGHESPLLAVKHAHWRRKSAEQAALAAESDLHFSAVLTMSRADAVRLRRMCVDFIERTRALVEPSKEEDIHGFVCDFFGL